MDEAGRRIIGLIEGMSRLARLTAAPPGVPADLLTALREAYRQALSDPALLAQAAKLQIPIDPLYGDDLAALVRDALDQAPETIELLRATANANTLKD